MFPKFRNLPTAHRLLTLPATQEATMSDKIDISPEAVEQLARDLPNSQWQAPNLHLARETLRALRARLAEVERQRDRAHEWTGQLHSDVAIYAARAERAEAALATARRDALLEAAQVAETAMQKHAKAHYSGEAVRVFRNGDDTLSESAAKTYCAGEILEAIRALANEAET